MKIQFLKQHRQFVGNGTHVFYQPGDEDEFEEKHGNALVYEGIGVQVKDAPSDDTGEGDLSEDVKSEGEAPENKARKRAPANKAK